jgi:hypothetical protein
MISMRECSMQLHYLNSAILSVVGAISFFITTTSADAQQSIESTRSEASPISDNLADDRGAFSRSTNTATIPASGAPITSTLSFDGVAFGLDDTWIYDLSTLDGTARDLSFTGSVTRILDQSLTDQRSRTLFQRNQNAWVLRLSSEQERVSTTLTQSQAGRMIGYQLDLSATGRCFLPGSTADDFCTYTPGMATVPGGYDPDTLVPTVFQIDSAVGDVITQDLHDSLKAPGFQRGEDVAGQPLVGLSFDVPFAGFIADEGAAAGLDRNQTVTNRLVLSVANIDQNLFSNSDSATLDRTVRAFVLLRPEEWTTAAFLTQVGAFWLPSMSRPLAPTQADARLNISNNLFYAANNARVPADSFTVFQTGSAFVDHSLTPPRSAAETPTAFYSGSWVGFSPVRTTTVTMNEGLIPLGPRTSVSGPSFAEGGIGSPFLDALDLGLTIFDSIDESITEINFQGIDDLYVQTGIDLSEQDALRTMTTTETNEFRYVPHLSYNGNMTTGISVTRYYLGVIMDDTPNVYIGGDYTVATEDGWNGYARLDLYSEPDADYTSELEAKIARSFRIDEESGFAFGISGLTQLGDGFDRNFVPTLDPDGTVVELVGQYDTGPLGLVARHRITDDPTDGVGRGTTFGLSYQPADRVGISAQATPYSSESNYIDAAFGISWQLTEDANSPVLTMQMARAIYSATSAFTSEKLTTTENIFELSLQARF